MKHLYTQSPIRKYPIWKRVKGVCITELPSSRLATSCYSHLKCIALLFCLTCTEGSSAQTPEKEELTIIPRPTFSITGTGRTTGHIANINVQNTYFKSIKIRPQTVYIPSSGQYQPYVGRIPEGIVIPPGGSVDILVSGYCVDVTKPPVPAGSAMPPVDEWIPVGGPVAVPVTPGAPDGSPDTEFSRNTIRSLITHPPVSVFEPSDIPDVVNSTGFRPVSDPDSDIIVTWPGSGVPVSGTLDPDADPRTFASVIVAALERIEHAVTVVQSDPDMKTPFSTNPEREAEALIQQTFWIYTSILTGDPYHKSDFTEITYTQFQENTGMPISKLTQKDKEEVDSGIGDFWNAFQATGVEAKVLSPSGQVFYNIDSETEPVFQDDPCDWYKICVDIYILARRDGDRCDLGAAFYQNPQERWNYSSRHVFLPAAEFNAAGLADITQNQTASKMVDNIRSNYAKVNQIYKECCICFEINKIYAVDISTAKAGENGPVLGEWIDWTHDRESDTYTSQLNLNKKIRSGRNEMEFLDATEAFIRHTGAPGNCLKMFLGQGLKQKDAGHRCAGIARCPGAHSVIGQGNVHPTNGGSATAHEIGHNLGLRHDNTEPTDGSRNMMYPSSGSSRGGAGVIPTTSIKITPEQCTKMAERVRSIGQRIDNPCDSGDNSEGGSDEGSAERPSPTGDGDRVPSPRPEDPDSGSRERRGGESDGRQEEDHESDDVEREQENLCPCPDPKTESTGLEELGQLQSGQEVSASVKVNACCASVVMKTKVKRVDRNKFTFTWDLSYQITDPECFVSLSLDRFYISKDFKIKWRRNSQSYHIPVRNVTFVQNPNGSFTLRGDGGFELNYEKVDRGRGDRFEIPEAEQRFVEFIPNATENSLNHSSDVQYWKVFLGGVIVCKSGSGTVNVPFHFAFTGSRGKVQLNGSPSELPESVTQGSVADGITRTPVYEHQ